MPVKHIQNPVTYIAWIYSTRLHVVMYATLLVATPFVMLQNFLQEAIGRLSVTKVKLFDFEIVLIPTIAIVLFSVALVFFRARLTKIRFLGALIVVAMIALAQQITDFYFDHNFYDLQQNWHYFAYSIFAILMYRDLSPRGFSWERIIQYTYFIALALSTFDEVFQMHMSNRIFDVSDIAKDVLGVLMGLFLVCFWVDRPFFLSQQGKRLHHRRLWDYFSQPTSQLFLLTVMTFFFVVFSSLLTDFPYWRHIIAFTLCTSAIFFILFHISQYRWGKSILLTAFLVIAVVQFFSFFKNRDRHIMHNRYGLSVYKGIMLPFFDIMIYPNGLFRPVDKKHFFNQRDRKFLLNQKTDIILISTGTHGRGGRGFPKKAVNQFLYNPFSYRGTQVIILKNKDACEVFNRLKQEKKNVLFILHNTC